MPRPARLLAVAVLLGSAPAAMAQVNGSYLETCRRVHQRGPILHARCLNRHGQWAETALDLRTCQAGDIANRNGRLICAGGRGVRSY